MGRFTLPLRNIHMDFHTSELIPDVGVVPSRFLYQSV